MTNSQLTQATVLHAKYSEDGKVVMILSLDNGESSTMRIYTKKYDEATKKFVSDEETFKTAMERLAKTGLDASLLELEDGDSFESVVAALRGQTFDVYYHDGRTSFMPIKVFPRYDRIDTKTYKDLSRRSDEVFTFEPITDFEGRRFNVGFKTDVKGEEKLLRVSQIIVVDPDDDDAENESYSLNYENKDITDIKEAMEGTSGAIHDELQKALTNTIERVRENAAEKLKMALNDQSILDMISTEERLEGKVAVQQIAGQTPPVYFLQMILEKSK